jgi:hypothetical protein
MGQHQARRLYLYDFGDNLKHTLVLESIHPAKKGIKYPRVVT